jgi:hypothetical protein
MVHRDILYVIAEAAGVSAVTVKLNHEHLVKSIYKGIQTGKLAPEITEDEIKGNYKK